MAAVNMERDASDNHASTLALPDLYANQGAYNDST